ncbi:MAG TPA: hypothetical protein DCR20_10740 [Planctomycetaceae bacterium]|nr:hypothetical protein [Planctomycetaceae bacterium]
MGRIPDRNKQAADHPAAYPARQTNARGRLGDSDEKRGFAAVLNIGSGDFGKFPGSAHRQQIPDLPVP